MTTFVLVPGANHGGWWYEPVVQALAAAGHEGLPVTLSGLDPDLPAPTEAVNLDTHVADLAAALGERRDLVLVGHSYGGSVITAVADVVPERVRALVYLDAFVPDDGDSAWSMTNDWEREWYIDGARADGRTVAPLPFFDDRARPHPLGTLLQASRLTGAWRRVPVKHYVQALDWGELESPMTPTADRLRGDPDWTVHGWDCTHNVLREGPERLTELLLAVDTDATGRAPGPGDVVSSGHA